MLSRRKKGVTGGSACQNRKVLRIGFRFKISVCRESIPASRRPRPAFIHLFALRHCEEPARRMTRQSTDNHLFGFIIPRIQFSFFPERDRPCPLSAESSDSPNFYLSGGKYAFTRRHNCLTSKLLNPNRRDCLIFHCLPIIPTRLDKNSGRLPFMKNFDAFKEHGDVIWNIANLLRGPYPPIAKDQADRYGLFRRALITISSTKI